jgi:hypothetical protein
MLIQQTKEQLHILKLTGMLDALEQQLAQPKTHELAFEQRLALIVGALPAGAKAVRAVTHRSWRRLLRTLDESTTEDRPADP